jgi:hypothetical protein
MDQNQSNIPELGSAHEQITAFLGRAKSSEPDAKAAQGVSTGVDRLVVCFLTGVRDRSP